jgi:hypothetical protein
VSRMLHCRVSYGKVGEMTRMSLHREPIGFGGPEATADCLGSHSASMWGPSWHRSSAVDFMQLAKSEGFYPR